MRIALSAKQLSMYIRVQKGISYTIKLKNKTRNPKPETRNP
jgi:hypothetical protein